MDTKKCNAAKRRIATKKRLCFISATLILVMLITLLFSGCGEVRVNTKKGVYFDTFVTLTAYGCEVPEECIEELKKYDTLFSKTEPDSDIVKLNSAGGKEVNVSDDTLELLNLAEKYRILSGGSFSHLSGALSELWGFKSDKPSIPKDSDINTALESVNKGSVEISGKSVRLTNGAKIDLGGIAKGYIADKIAEIYKNNNVSGIIDLGGNILTVGEKPDGSLFSVGIKNPENTDEVKLKLEFSGGAVVTSGTYERNFTYENKLYHHLLDLSTGYPVDNGLCSVTIIAENSAAADALSTAVFCMGETDGKTLIETLDNTEAVFVRTNGQVSTTSGLRVTDDKITFK
mgnify:CR=1 FL=1